jgi:hypothetical protein
MVLLLPEAISQKGGTHLPPGPYFGHVPKSALFIHTYIFNSMSKATALVKRLKDDTVIRTVGKPEFFSIYKNRLWGNVMDFSLEYITHKEAKAEFKALNRKHPVTKQSAINYINALKK